DGSRRAPISLCGRNAVQIHERQRPIDLQQLQSRLETIGTVRANEFALRLSLPKYEITVFADGRAIIKGTQDVGVARSLYAQYVGAQDYSSDPVVFAPATQFVPPVPLCPTAVHPRLHHVPSIHGFYGVH